MVHQHTTSAHLSVQGIVPWYGSTLFVKGKPAIWVREGHSHNATPALAVVTVPVPDPTETSDVWPRDPGSVHHSSTRPFAPLCPTGPLLCCVHERYGKRIPRPHHSWRRFWVASPVRTLAFTLAWPMIQSIIVLQSPLISSAGSFPDSSTPSSSGGKSLDCFVGTGP